MFRIDTTFSHPCWTVPQPTAPSGKRCSGPWWRKSGSRVATPEVADDNAVQQIDEQSSWGRLAYPYEVVHDRHARVSKLRANTCRKDPQHDQYPLDD